MEVKEMKELIAAVSAANVDEFEYNNEEFSIRIAKKKAKIATVDASVAGVPVQSAAIMPEQNEEQPEDIDRLKRMPTIIEMPYNEVVQKFIDRYSGKLRRSPELTVITLKRDL